LIGLVEKEVQEMEEKERQEKRKRGPKLKARKYSLCSFKDHIISL